MSGESRNGSTVLPMEPPFVPEATLPPLPDTVETSSKIGGIADDEIEIDIGIEDTREPIPQPGPILRGRALRAGCHLLRYTPTQRAGALQNVHYDGTMRIERQDR